jgi:hypothetical protein
MFGVWQVASCPNHHFLTSPQTIKNKSSYTAAAFVGEIVTLEFIAHGVVILAGCKVDGDAPPPSALRTTTTLTRAIRIGNRHGGGI